MLFESADLEVAEMLSELLRERGLHPMLVSQRASSGISELVVQISLPESEFARAQVIVSRFSAKRAES